MILEMLFWWTLFHVILFMVVCFFRSIVIKHKIKLDGYEIVKKPLLVRISIEARSAFAACIPIYGTFLLVASILVDDDNLILHGIKKGDIKKLGVKQ